MSMALAPNVADGGMAEGAASKVVLGMGLSHSVLLTLDAASWATRAEDDLNSKELNLSDGRFVDYEQLKSEVGEKYAGHVRVDRFAEQAAYAHASLDHLADELERASPDVAIIIGDDHGELFGPSNVPAIAIFYGDEFVMRPWGETYENPPQWFSTAMQAYAMDAPRRFAGSAAFARQLIQHLMNDGVDVSGLASVANARDHGVGHAFGFVIKRLFRGRQIPVVPIFLNTYYPPNVVRPARCYDVGRKLREAVERIPGGLRVAVIASGGLSHFVTDEPLDRRVLDGLRDHDEASLGTIPMESLHSGSSEILCWIMAAGALQGLRNDWTHYTPVYRTPAGTGVGLAFAAWR